MESITYLKIESENQIKRLANIAREIWFDYFGPMFEKDTLAYLFNQVQSKKAISNQIKEGYLYYLIETNGRQIGYFAYKLDNDLPFIYGNYQRLQQVFINLIQNACQALPDDNHRIHISSIYDDKKIEIVVKVQDEGKGIEKKDLKNITDPFFTTKRSQGGTGLGLSISLKIISWLFSTIWSLVSILEIFSNIDC